MTTFLSKQAVSLLFACFQNALSYIAMAISYARKCL